MDPKTLDKALSVFHFLAEYHNHKVISIENIPRQGPTLIIINHSLATYDAFLLAGAIYQHTGRICRALGDRRIFQTPFLSRIATKLGMVQGLPLAGEKLLEQGHLLIVSPGGMRESLRSVKKRYQVLWDNRLGFIRLALNTQTPIILVACPLADNLYSVYDNPLTSLVYERFKLPLPIARGLGATFLPRPISLQHYVRQPILPPKIPKEKLNGEISKFHWHVIKEMEKLISLSLEKSLAGSNVQHATSFASRFSTDST